MKKVFEILCDKNIDDINEKNLLEQKTTLIYSILENDKALDISLKIEVRQTPKRIVEKENITFLINAKHLKTTKSKYLKRIKKIKNNGFPQLLQVLVINYNKVDENDVIDLIRAIKIQFFLSTKEKYEYIYDNVCNYLDNKFVCENICEFENNKCIAKRQYDLTCGCCRHYKSIFSNKLVQCEYLIDNRCSTKCIACKLFTCNYLVKNKGIKYRINKIFLLKYYFNYIQKIVIISCFFTKKEIIIRRLLQFTA